MLAERGVALTDETGRRWCRTFGQRYANAPRRRPQPGDTWHLDAVFIRVNGRAHALWRAVDQDGQGRDIRVQARREQRAAVQFLRKPRKGRHDVPRVLIIDPLASDGAAKDVVPPSVEPRRYGGPNNRTEHAHQPTRERERRLRRCKDPGQAQRFLAAYGPIADHFRPRRHRRTAHDYRQTRDERCASWRAVTGLLVAARAKTTPRPSTPSRRLLRATPAQLDNAGS